MAGEAVPTAFPIFWLQRLHLLQGAPQTHETRPYNQMSVQ